MVNDPERESICRRLKGHHALMQELIDLIGERRRIDGNEREQAQQLLKQIKAELIHDYKHGVSLQGQANASEDELAFFFPAIHEALCTIHVRVNSIPGPSWISDLFSAQGLLQYYIQQLEPLEKTSISLVST
ncbi:MAG TPA: hypothetical protein VHV83_15410 [Armatimonadota bacterium]|nr:hypothetical protein [Armatimonadota bacterium]